GAGATGRRPPRRGAGPARRASQASDGARDAEPPQPVAGRARGRGDVRPRRRRFGAIGAPIGRLVGVRIGAVRLDGLVSGRARLLKAPEVRVLGTGVAAGPPPGPSLKLWRPAGGRTRQP